MCENLPTELTKAGYYFVGWYDTADSSQKILPASHVFKANTTVKAKWATAIKITFKANGGTFDPEGDPVIYIKAKTPVGEKMDFSIKREGYTLKGWFTEKTGGMRVTAETAPHYLMLTEQELLRRDADFRMNPPLRTETDRLAMIEALRDGTIDAIATDHAPHTPQEKADFVHAPNGSIGMETSFAAAYTVLVEGNILTEGELIRKMSVHPDRILYQADST